MTAHPPASTHSSTTREEAEKNYKATLGLPVTTFPMRAGAINREPELQAFWEAQGIYQQVLEARKQGPRFLLHDGPPYLSSDKIHIGTALNKILKDIVTRYKAQQGFYAPYVPGYDGHGLPIEAAVEKTIKGGRKAVSDLELRQQCRAFALANVEGQKQNFKRLGVWGDWDNPYITIDGAFEATQVELFTTMAEKGYVYKGLKPVHWCPVSESALAEAEIEYADHESHSIYVAFPLPSLHKAFAAPLSTQHVEALTDAQLVIWTTTPWTLPANVAIAVHPTVEYVVVQGQRSKQKLVLAEALLEQALPRFEDTYPEETWSVLATFTGEVLEGLQAKHPFLERTSVVLLGQHVTTETGTGLVHTAPGHGPDDFMMVQAYNRQNVLPEALPVLSPIDSQGRLTPEPWMPEGLAGQFYEQANFLILEVLKNTQSLLAHKRFKHSYPHSWRSNAPIIFRATEQWFIKLDAFRQQALDAIAGVQWVPARGETRISSMVEGRPEWCISRQRVWGVPIPAFYCEDCGELHLSSQATALVAEAFRKESSDAWVRLSAGELLQDKISCQACGSKRFRKETDVMDVWFDSGVTHTAVVEARSEASERFPTQALGHLPAELYLEGSDQHRGWFQSSLLTSVMLHEKAPYKAVLTHGFVLDENGRKMSKSRGNVVDPNTVMREAGADVLRLWVASVDYSSDVRLGHNTLKQLADIYRKIRNTARFMLGNLSGFNPATDRIAYEQLGALDKYVLHRLQHVMQTITEAFNNYEFYRFYQLLQNFCVVELSSLYFDIVKDVLYCNAASDPRRQAIQTVLYDVLSVLSRLIVPVMPHLAEDIWQHWPTEQRPNFEAGSSSPPVSILLAAWPVAEPHWAMPEKEVLTFERLLSVRETVNLALEEARSNDLLGSALEARVVLQPLKVEEGRSELEALLYATPNEELETLFLTSQVELLPDGAETPEQWPATANGQPAVLGYAEEPDTLRLWVVAPAGDKCVRCWKHKPEVGSSANHPHLCHRCETAVIAG